MAGDAITLEGRKVAQGALLDSLSASGKTYDMYAPLLNYKQAITQSNRPGIEISWVPADHERRIKAYELLWSYWNNLSRDYRRAPETGDTSKNDDLMEMGDAAWLSDKIKSKLLGNDVMIFANTARLKSHIKTLTALVATFQDAKLKPVLEAKLKELQDKLLLSPAQEAYMVDWWHDQGIFNVIDCNETKIGYLGDGVYKVEWDDEEKTVKLCTYDPGFVFPYSYTDNPVPSYDTEAKDLVVQRFVLAWEIPESNSDNFQVYREVYELRVKTNGEKRCFLQRSYFDFNSAESDITTLGVEELVEGNSLTFTDTLLDFIPFVWIANKAVQGEEPFGLSNLHFSIDMLDNMITSYFDLATNAEYLGGVTIIASGKDTKFKRDSSGEVLSVKIAPKRMYHVGEDGSIELLDTSKMQDALLKTMEQQDAKFLRNNDIPEVVAGKLKGSDIPSGVALAIMLQPLVDKLQPMRQRRYEDYAYLFYYVMRLFAVKGDDYARALFSSGTLPEISLKFGSLSPNDESDAVDRYVKMGQFLDEETVLEIAKGEGLGIDIALVKERLAKQKDENLKRQQDLFTTRAKNDSLSEGA